MHICGLRVHIDLIRLEVFFKLMDIKSKRYSLRHKPGNPAPRKFPRVLFYCRKIKIAETYVETNLNFTELYKQKFFTEVYKGHCHTADCDGDTTIFAVTFSIIIIAFLSKIPKSN